MKMLKDLLIEKDRRIMELEKELKNNRLASVEHHENSLFGKQFQKPYQQLVSHLKSTSSRAV